MINNKIRKLDVMLNGKIPKSLFVSTTPNKTFPYENPTNKSEKGMLHRAYDYDDAFVLLLRNKTSWNSDSDGDDCDSGSADYHKRLGGMGDLVGDDFVNLAAQLLDCAHKSGIDLDGYADELDPIRW
ncbi:unnamed protein product [Ambrosiozyma monospora]|uniref:Unnamed protein product n=1 Tax=Ambrosiozyma monospora TaxID=43982 RepID=A0ACB5TBC0_AMBMO|nr:unnamed protein product [Ambrosiozyma monospora]